MFPYNCLLISCLANFLEVTENSIYPSSTTSKESFHGTGISLFQHPTYDGEGVDRSIVDVSSKSVDNLPHFYTDVPPAC